MREMAKNKISKAEKIILKGLIELAKERGYEQTAGNFEYEMMHITGNRNCDHRQAIEDYAQELLDK